MMKDALETAPLITEILATLTVVLCAASLGARVLANVTRRDRHRAGRHAASVGAKR